MTIPVEDLCTTFQLFIWIQQLLKSSNHTKKNPNIQGPKKKSIKPNSWNNLNKQMWYKTKILRKNPQKTNFLYPPETNIAPTNWWLEDELSFWNSLFSGAMLVSRRGNLCCVKISYPGVFLSNVAASAPSYQQTSEHDLNRCPPGGKKPWGSGLQGEPPLPAPPKSCQYDPKGWFS